MRMGLISLMASQSRSSLVSGNEFSIQYNHRERRGSMVQPTSDNGGGVVTVWTSASHRNLLHSFICSLKMALKDFSKDPSSVNGGVR